MNQEELLAELRPWLKALAARHSNDPGTQQDLAQEGWIAAWRQLQKPETPTDNAVGWCREAARWQIRRLIAGQRMTGAPPRAYGAAKGTDVPVPVESPAWEMMQQIEDDLELAYHHGEIHRAISELAPRKQEYIHLRFFVGLNTPEMEEYFGYKPFALWTGPWGAKTILKTKLAHLREGQEGHL